MDGILSELDQIFADYRRELDESEKKHKPTDGLFGFGHSIKDDACHDRFDVKMRETVEKIAAEQPSSDETAQFIRLLFTESDHHEYSLSAKWMLIAAERHILPLIPFLKEEDAAVLAAEYGKRYRLWNRLPAQKQVLAALKKRGKADK